LRIRKKKNFDKKSGKMKKAWKILTFLEFLKNQDVSAKSGSLK